MATAEDDLDKEDITLLSLLCIDNFIDSSSSSSDETSGESDDEALLLKTATAMIERMTIPKIGSFVDIVLRNFRLSRGTFHRLDHLAGKVQRREYKGGRPQLTLEKQILIALWYFANTECYRSIASRFDVSDSTVMKSVDGIVSAMVKDKNKLIRMPGVVGAIDGTHIAIPGPNQHHENYINRKRFHSIVAQVVCDHEMKFMSVNTGWPGSVHDAQGDMLNDEEIIMDDHVNNGPGLQGIVESGNKPEKK
ncbi:unnamed protein product [Mytilus coruscus]|uniref:DDE Tnp4 domain-containing protein n=1 Tax=Mytilus coruscus TaxID=42192 RepID=A0A6J8BLU8_MYTCO|nr:unnamed protein product [Mytilus coruscus]